MKEYDRITSVLSPYSGFDRIPVHILEAASERGVLVHKYASALIRNVGLFGVEEHLKGYIESFKLWKPKSKMIIPSRFFEDDLLISGEADCLYEIEDGYCLVDFKTSTKEGSTWNLQGSAYANLARKAGYNIKRIEFVKLSKEGKQPIVYTYTENFDLFLKCLDVYRAYFKDRKDLVDYEI